MTTTISDPFKASRRFTNLAIGALVPSASLVAIVFVSDDHGVRSMAIFALVLIAGAMTFESVIEARRVRNAKRALGLND